MEGEKCVGVATVLWTNCVRTTWTESFVKILIVFRD